MTGPDGGENRVRDSPNLFKKCKILSPYVPLYSATFLLSFYSLSKLSNPIPLLLLLRRRREGVDSAPAVAMHAMGTGEDLGLRSLTNTAKEASPPPRVGS